MPITDKELKDSLQTSFINRSFNSSDHLQSQLIENYSEKMKCVLDTLLYELSTCKQFFLSAAFLTKSGVAVLINSLLEAEERGVQGKILVSEYLEFTQPEALRALRQFKCIEVRVATQGNMHGKTYLFDKIDYSSIMVGSSNLTAAALKTNNEINIKISLKREGSVYKSVLAHLERDFNDACVADESYINEYKVRYKSKEAVRLGGQFPSDTTTRDEDVSDSNNANFPNKGIEISKVAEGSTVYTREEILPNSMQEAALKNLKNLRNKKENKGLLVSATGTGKTYLSAFDVKAYGGKRLLFIVHRRNIAKAALRSYKNLFADSKTYGLFSGNERDLSADFIFTTIQTLSKDSHLSGIDPYLFDYIVIDETHRAGASTYQKIIQHFKPKFLLGMTATPERTDGHDVFADFDHNIAYEIRLHQAMQEDILCPFHYFGVTDVSVDGQEVGDETDFNSLVSEERVKHVFNKSQLYGCDNGEVRGLIFCSRKEECRALSNQLNKMGLKTVVLTGEDSEETRENSIKYLESTGEKDKLDYIITVDIFNEGIDIPRVNQILMLRPTSSAIIFVQQLGRGLRKALGKEYLTVIDFIGNYKNNYLVPIALYGDTSYNKDKLRRLINSGSSAIPGSSTINFDRISRKKIFDSIDQTNLRMFKDLKEDYKLLKYEIGRTPMMMDFVNYDRRDPFLFVQYAGSHYEFVRRVENEYEQLLTDSEVEILSIFSKEINNGKRVEDSIALRQMIVDGVTTSSSLCQEIKELYGYIPKPAVVESVFHNLSLKFVTDRVDTGIVPVVEKLGYDVTKVTSEACEPSEIFKGFLLNQEFREFLIDSTDYSIDVCSRALGKSELIGGFLLYEKYSRKDVFRILNWSKNPIAQNVGGYQMSPDKKDCAIFVNYDKADHSSSTQYVDEFVSEREFNWMSKNRRKLTSPEIVQFQQTENPTRLPLFIKKSNDEGLDFYYIGELKPIIGSFEEKFIKNDDGKELPAVAVRFEIYPHVQRDIYNYLTSL